MFKSPIQETEKGCGEYFDENMNCMEGCLCPWCEEKIKTLKQCQTIADGKYNKLKDKDDFIIKKLEGMIDNLQTQKSELIEKIKEKLNKFDDLSFTKLEICILLDTFKNQSQQNKSFGGSISNNAGVDMERLSDEQGKTGSADTQTICPLGETKPDFDTDTKGCGKYISESSDYGFIVCGDILEENEDTGKRELCPECRRKQ
jgi:hypothetical protein